MLDPTAWQRRAYSKGKAIGGLSYDQLLKSIAVNAKWQPRKVDWKQSYDYFDGLDDPYREIDFYVDGRMHSASTASVLRINQGDHNAAVATGRALLARLKASGLLVDTLDANEAARPWEAYRNTYRLNAGTGRGEFTWLRDPMLVTTDVRVNDPARFLTEYPIKGDFWNGSAAMSLQNLPIPRVGPSDVVYIGPSFWNFAGSGENVYSTSRMVDDMTEALACIIALHKSSNAHPGMSPALNLGMRSPDWSAWLGETLRESDSSFTTTRAASLFGRATAVGALTGESHFAGVNWVERGIGYFPSRFALPSAYDCEPSAWDFDIRGPSNALWRASAASRQRRYAEDTTAETTTADAVVDYAQIMNLLAYFVELPPHVLLHSCMYFHNFLFRTSYLQIEEPYGTSFAQYRQRLNVEYSATSQASAIEKASQGFDFSGTPNSLEGQTVKSLAVAIAACAAGGPIGAVFGIGALALQSIGAMIEEMNRAPIAYRPDPGRSLLRDRWHSGISNNFWRYYTPDQVINSRPCIVYE